MESLSVYLVNPSDNSFGTAVITPRWLFVLAAATPREAGDPILVDESLEQIVPETIRPGDIVGISVHTGNALRGYAVGRMARSRGAWVIYGGIHATLFPDEVLERGEAHAVVTGDGDIAWGKAVADCLAGKPQKIYEGGRIEGHEFLPSMRIPLNPLLSAGNALAMARVRAVILATVPSEVILPRAILWFWICFL